VPLVRQLQHGRPTCYCYDVADDVELGSQAGKRTRFWDFCQFANHALVASGENFRGPRASRIKFRFYHKTAADVITPTAMNAASIERDFRRAVEQCADRDEAAIARRLQMIARACDPCISCSVHLVRKR
jgi:hypothetical protein